MRPMHRADPRRSAFFNAIFVVSRRAFTLVELLVVIAIVLILTAVTITSFNFSVSADRMRAGARQVQSILVGARDKAIYAKEVRGVRLLLDPNDNHSVSAVQYIGSPQRETGTLSFDPTGLIISQGSVGVSWTGLINRGLLRAGARIQIPRDTGSWFTVSGLSGGSLALNRANVDLANTQGVGYVLELSASVLGESQPVQLPRGVVIDLDGSQIPSGWRPALFSGSYSPKMDILFTPRGTVVGDALGIGTIHLHFADAGDVTKWKSIGGRSASYYNSASLPLVPADDPGSSVPVVTRDRILTTVATRTGNVSVHYVNPTNSIVSPTTPIEKQKLADDPYSFAETGQVANK
jgi:prepilin-type N-terminal cleavage/methylation domain-containing protein